MARASERWCAGQQVVDRRRAACRAGSTSQAATIVLIIGAEAHPLAVLGREDLGDAVGLERLDLARHDHAAAAAVHPHVAGALGPEAVDEVAEVLVVAALVRRHRHALHVLLDHRGDDLVDRAVVPEVDHLAALRLEDPPHDVDGGVVPVEQAGRGDEAHGVLGDVQPPSCCRGYGESPRAPKPARRYRRRHADRARREGLDLGARAGVPRVRLRHPARRSRTTSPVASPRTTAAWRAILERRDVRDRPDDSTGHRSSTRATCATSTASTPAGSAGCSTEDDPHYENWDQDATAVEDRYAEQDPAIVADELAAAGGTLGALFAGVDGRRLGAHRPAQRRRLVHRRLDRPLLPPRHRAPHLGRHGRAARPRPERARQASRRSSGGLTRNQW